MLQGQDGVDLEMNLNGNKSRGDDDEFSDLVPWVYLIYLCIFMFCLIFHLVYIGVNQIWVLSGEISKMTVYTLKHGRGLDFCLLSYSVP